MLALLLPLMLAADESVFSGPQPGEKLPAFKAVGAYDEEAKERDFIKHAGGKPTMIVFVHEVTRPSAALMRALSAYAASRDKDGLKACFVWLTRDRTETVKFLKTARMSLGLKSEVLISLDGIEGPGAYGLNRKVGLTVLVAKEGKVTANFALIQPAVTDAPLIAEAICKAAGGKAPNLKELETLAFPGRKPATQPERDPALVGLLRRIINKDATPDDVKQAAESVEKHVGEKKDLQKQLGEIAAVVVQNKYGTEAAQKQMKVWADKYAPKR